MKLRNSWLLTLNTLRVTFRKKGSLIVFFVLPIVGILFSMVIYSDFGNGILKLGVTDQDKSMISGDLVKALGKQEHFKIIPLEEQDISNQVTSGKVDCVLTIPQSFADNLYKNNPETLAITSIRGSAATAWIESYANVYVQNLRDIAESAAGNKNSFDRMYDDFRQEKMSLKLNKVQDQAKSKGMSSQSIGFLIMFMMIGAGTAAEMILREKRSRTYYRICSAPVSSRTYILGNVLANILIILLQILLTLVLLTKAFRINTYIPFPELFAILACFGLVAVGLGLLIVAFSSNSMQAGTLQTLIITPTSMLAGCFWPISMMPKGMQRLADFLPQTWAIGAIQKLQQGESFSKILINLTIVLAFALVFFLIAAYRFSKDDDMRMFV